MLTSIYNRNCPGNNFVSKRKKISQEQFSFSFNIKALADFFPRLSLCSSRTKA
jgi:hypothetical protein